MLSVRFAIATAVVEPIKDSVKVYRDTSHGVKHAHSQNFQVQNQGNICILPHYAYPIHGVHVRTIVVAGVRCQVSSINLLCIRAYCIFNIRTHVQFVVNAVS